MDTTFQLEVYSLVRNLPPIDVSLVELPAVDGEIGILPGHENVIGLLGTGPLKYVSNGNDFWLLVSAGSYQVDGGKLRIVAELVEDAKGVDPEATRAHIAQLESSLVGKETTSPEYVAADLECKREKARLEVHRRVELVN